MELIYTFLVFPTKDCICAERLRICAVCRGAWLSNILVIDLHKDESLSICGIREASLALLHLFFTSYFTLYVAYVEYFLIKVPIHRIIVGPHFARRMVACSASLR